MRRRSREGGRHAQAMTYLKGSARPMHVLISWSGSDSRTIATALRDWIPRVLPQVKPWMSSTDIAKGTRWSAELAKQLHLADFGLVVVTPSNLREPWIIFEAGALSKDLDAARVIPILVGVEPRELPGPLAQFQAAGWSESELWAVVQSINDGMGGEARNLTELKRDFEKHVASLHVKEVKVTRPLKRTEQPDKARRRVPSVNEAEISILLMAFEAPETRGFDFIDHEDVRTELDLPAKKTDYHLHRLTSQGLLEEDDGTWTITLEGTEWLTKAGRV